MDTSSILKTIGERCGGDIYLGVVGPVRVGKSTFIKRFMELAVIPYMSDEYEKARSIDELPQSGEGRTIMTMEPKFVPNQAANITFDDGFQVKVRLVDCVGFIIPEAKGYKDENGIRMVRTPWFEDAIPFNEAAKIGTQKVIKEHSTIGIVVTSDGSICDLSRESYIDAESEVIDELINIGKPFIVIINSVNPNGTYCQSIKDKLTEKYNVPVLPLSVQNLNENELLSVLKEALYEFPVAEINIEIPSWLKVLDAEHPLKKSITTTISDSLKQISKLREINEITSLLKQNDNIDSANLKDLDIGKGIANVEIKLKNGLYNNILKEIIGEEISDKADLIRIMQEFSKAKKEYDSIAGALSMVKQTGYGFAGSNINDIVLSKPEIIKQGARYGVKITAKAPSIHMIKVDVDSVFEPIIGSQSQCEELIKYLLRDESNPNAIWESEIFGRHLSDIIRDGMNSKLSMIPENARVRLQEILKKLVNKGKGNVIAIVL